MLNHFPHLMKHYFLNITMLASILMLTTACASVKIYSDQDLKTETGLRYYTLKPYLLVEYNADKNNTVKTSVVYLPDIASPQYLKMNPGVGSGNVKLSFKDGAIDSYGVTTASQMSDAFEAFAAILSKSAYAAQAFSGPPAGEVEEPVFRLYEIVPGKGGMVLKEVERLE
jgi:hypothetical protein